MPTLISEADKKQLKSFALDQGFDVARVASADPGEIPGQHLEEFLTLGRHGDMDWLETRKDWRRHPQNLWPEAKSALVLGLNYGPSEDPRKLAGCADRGIISVYAQGRDYHDLIRKRLKRIARWIVSEHGSDVKVFVDTAPVMEKPLAEAAGVGWQGKHTNLLSREFGSWLFLGVILTTLEINPDEPETGDCGRCTACLDVCPTNAFPAPYQLDARKCISYLTIETRTHIPREYRALIGNRIYGCDDCLAICPWNKYAKRTRELAFVPRSELTAPRLADLVTLDDPGFREVFSGSPIKRLGRNRFVRNALIGLGNCGDARHIGVIEPLLSDASFQVRVAAVWALGRLTGREEFSEHFDRCYPAEEDQDVREEWDFWQETKEHE